jgi:hypothetical protein
MKSWLLGIHVRLVGNPEVTPIDVNWCKIIESLTERFNST